MIREAGEADLARVQEIYAHHVMHGLATWETVPPDLAEMTRRFHKVQELGLPFLVTEDQGRILGFCYAGLYRERPGWAYTVEDSIYLDPAATGQGLGTALLNEVCERCEALGIRMIVAAIGDSANDPSRNLHRKCGFIDAGILPMSGWKHGRWVDCVFAYRLLGEQGAPPEGRGWLPVDGAQT